MDELEVLKNIEKKLSAIIVLLIRSEHVNNGEVDKKSLPKVEVLLEGVGLKAPEIAKLLNKKESAVRKALHRARK